MVHFNILLFNNILVKITSMLEPQDDDDNLKYSTFQQ